MKTALAAALFLFALRPALAHRLDEYLQGTIITVEKNRIRVELTLAPGVAVLPTVLAVIDTDSNGVITENEERAYGDRVLLDLSLTIDGYPLAPQLVSMQFSPMEAMKDGRGEIRIDFKADLPPGRRHRRLILENHHQSGIAAYQVNSLVPGDADVQIVSQKRSYNQSFYQLDYVQAGARAEVLTSTGRRWLGTAMLILFLWLMIIRRHRS